MNTPVTTIDPRYSDPAAAATGCNSWQSGLDVVLEGDAVQVGDEALLQRLARAWSAKWDGSWQFQVRDGSFQHMEGGPVLVFAVAPVKVLAFAKDQPFSHTTHRFAATPGTAR